MQKRGCYEMVFFLRIAPTPTRLDGRTNERDPLSSAREVEEKCSWDTSQGQFCTQACKGSTNSFVSVRFRVTCVI